jgi:type I restriction enzyme S subunit
MITAPQPIESATAWTTVTLGEVCQINPGKPKADALPSRSLVTFVPMAAVDESLGSITNPEEREFSKVRGSYTAFKNDDVLFAKITPCMENGKAAIARDLVNGLGFGSSEFHVLRPSERVLPEFLYYLVRQKSFRAEAKDKMTGSVGQARVPTEWLKNFEIALPSIDEQRTIIGLVGQLQEQMESTSDRLTTIPTLLKRFRQSVLAAACSGQLTAAWREANIEGESGHKLAARMAAATPDKKLRSVPEELDLELPETWAWAAIGNIAAIRGGIQKQPHRAPKANAYPYLRVANVLRNRLDLRDLSMFELAPGELETYRLESGDLLVVEGNGSFNEIGRASIWRNEVPNCVHQNHIIRVRFNGLVPEFVNCFWNSPIGIEQVTATAVTTSGLYSLSTGKIASLMIPVPGKDEQREIVRRVESLFALADSIESRLNEATRQVERTTQAILATAFRGEL